ncbi:MAG: glutamate racemase [Candidatus Sedimenticola sp. 20ELBAFRAG]
MKPTSPIGIFDSGIGGLSVLAHLRRELPNEDLVYVADSGFAPYGQRSAEHIRARSETIASFLQSREAKTIVVACNTATAVAATALRRAMDIPVIGVEPGLKPAANRTRSGVIGILATHGTLNSEKYSHLVNRYGREVEVISQTCNGLADLVEQGLTDSDEARGLLAQYLEPIRQRGADTIALGCTHYPFLIPEIKRITGEATDIIDTGSAVAGETRRRLEPNCLHPDPDREGHTHFFASGSVEEATRRIALYWPEPVRVRPLP